MAATAAAPGTIATIQFETGGPLEMVIGDLASGTPKIVPFLQRRLIVIHRAAMRRHAVSIAAAMLIVIGCGSDEPPVRDGGVGGRGWHPAARWVEGRRQRWHRRRDGRKGRRCRNWRRGWHRWRASGTGGARGNWRRGRHRRRDRGNWRRGGQRRRDRGNWRRSRDWRRGGHRWRDGRNGRRGGQRRRNRGNWRRSRNWRRSGEPAAQPEPAA